MRKRIRTICTYDKTSCVFAFGYSGGDETNSYVNGLVLCIPLIFGTLALGIGLKVLTDNNNNHAKKPSKT